LATAAGLASGIDLDQLVLRSGDTVDASEAAPSPAVRITGDDRTRFGLDITGATPGEPFWLVLGQSHSLGWELDGRTPELVDGYANGWLVTPDAAEVHLDIEWRPQRVVSAALAASALAVVGCLLIALLPLLSRRLAGRGRSTAATATSPVDEPLAVPAASLRWQAGVVAAVAGERTATAGWRGGVVAAVGIGSAIAIGPLAGVVVTLGAAAMAWGPPRARRAARLLPVGAYGLAAAYIGGRQLVSRPGSAFEWPAEQATAHQPALVAIGLLVAVVALDARRTTEAPTVEGARPPGDDPGAEAPRSD